MYKIKRKVTDILERMFGIVVAGLYIVLVCLPVIAIGGLAYQCSLIRLHILCARFLRRNAFAIAAYFYKNAVSPWITFIDYMLYGEKCIWLDPVLREKADAFTKLVETYDGLIEV